MTHRRLLHILLVLGLSSAGGPLAAQSPTPMIVGIWKLNPEKSTVRVSPNHFEMRQYSLRPDGYLVGLLITADSPGAYHTLQFTAKSDGKDYPEYSDVIIADMIAAGKATPRTYSEKMDDAYTTDWTDKRDGKITSHGKKIVSKDGKTLTVTVDGSQQVYVYDRQ